VKYDVIISVSEIRSFGTLRCATSEANDFNACLSYVYTIENLLNHRVAIPFPFLFLSLCGDASLHEFSFLDFNTVTLLTPRIAFSEFFCAARRGRILITSVVVNG
jgi:hypothetical protein